MRKIALTFLFTSLAWWSPHAAAAGEPLTLDRARELARKNSPTLKVIREQLYQAEMLIDKAWVMVKPQLNATGTYTHTEPDASLPIPLLCFNSSQFPNPPNENECNGQYFDYLGEKKLDIIKSDSFGFTATLFQPLFMARAYTAIKTAHAGYDLAKISTRNVEDFLLHSLDVAYFGALTARKFLVSSKKAVVLRREHLKIAKAKFEVGDQPKITVLRAEIDLNRTEQDVKQAENSLALVKEAIGLLVGVDPDFDLVEPEAAGRPTDSLQSFVDKALAQRRDLEIARLNLDIAERTKQDAWFRFLPTLALTGMFRASDVKGFTGEYYTWNVGLALSIPLYDGGLRYAELEVARSRIRQATIEIDNKKRAIISEIRRLWLEMGSAEANLEKARRTLELALEQAQLSKVSFEAGAITNLEVLDANHVLFLSEISVAQLELSLQLTIMKLEKAVRMFNPTGASMAGASSSAPSSGESIGAPEASGASMGSAPGMGM